VIRHTAFALALSGGLALAALLVAPAQADDKKGESIKLFNGKNFEGWKFFVDPRAKDAKPDEAWSVQNETIVCKGKPAGYIITEREYENYLLELEWKWGEKPGNSGVLLHASGPDKIWPKSAEAQLMSGNAGDIWLIGFKMDVDKGRQDPKVDRHYFRIDRERKVEKPIGEWNKYEITCKGDTIRLVINGTFVNEGKNAELSKGKIVLQSEGAEIHFRNIRLTPLSGK
jgi:hypothetical protein